MSYILRSLFVALFGFEALALPAARAAAAPRGHRGARQAAAARGPERHRPWRLEVKARLKQLIKTYI